MRAFIQKQNQPQRRVSPNITMSNTMAPAASHLAYPRLDLQRTIGDPAVPRLLQAKSEDLEVGSSTTAVTRFGHDFSRIPVYPKSPANVQAKLTVSPPGDIYEQEAERVSEQMMRMPARDAPDQLLTGTEGKESAPNSRRNIVTAGSSSSVSDNFISTLANGQPLDTPTRNYFEPRFGADFSQVRIHKDSRATRAVNALAFTSGRSIVTAPQLTGGSRWHILAHELVHVMQQSRSAPARHEREAKHPADVLMHGAPVDVHEHVPATSIQRFISQEHRSLGDTATGGALVNVGGEMPAERFELSHGDVIALSGDYFHLDDPRRPNDGLRQLAKRPGDRGGKVGTRDEIIWALKVIDAADARFSAGGIWDGFVFTDEVKEAVERRYDRLAAENTSHFFAPSGRDAAGQPIRGSATGPSAFGSYRELHESALWLAYTDGGTAAGDISRAMATEAAAQHFLTDSFSAGHLRTPAALIRSYWGGRYPLFWYNLLQKMALDTAIRLNDIDSNVTTSLGTVQQMYEEIIAQVNTIASSLPPITLGDLVSKVFHDFDNEMGLAVSGGRVFGDENLDEKTPANITRAIAQDAILAGNHDVRKAFALGRSMPGLSKAEVFRNVRAATGAPADRYMAETRIPDLDPSNPPQNWRAPDFETLWSQPMLGTSGPTVGDRITAAMAPGNEIRNKLDGLAERFPTVKASRAGDVHPQRAYLEGFLQPLARDPRAGIFSIIHWAPNYGLRDVDRDDIALATGGELSTAGKLPGMTPQARAAYVRELVGGYVSDEEEAIVMEIFSTAPAAERPNIYQLVEGHEWNGDWRHGVTVSDDKIWNALDRTDLARLRTLINAGVLTGVPSAP
jgi:hypothetical protein